MIIYILLCTNVFFGTLASLLFRPRVCSRCSRPRSTQGPRRNTRAQVWALRNFRGTCSGGSKSHVPTGRHSEPVGPSRPLQTHVQVKECPTAHVISRILNVINVVCHYLLGQILNCPGTAHAEFNCTGEASAMFMKPPQTLVGDPSTRQTSYGKNSDCVMNARRNVLIRGSDSPWGQSSHVGR